MGVMNIPRIFDRVAAQTAAETFPLAIDVKAIDDCTVDGNNVRYRTPAVNAGSSDGSLIKTRPSNGNKANVTDRVAR